MEGFINKYIQYLDNFRKLSQNTISAYKIDILQFFDYLKSINQEINTINKDEIRKFFEKMYDQNIISRSIARKISCIKSFASYLIHHGNFTPEDLKNIVNLRQPKIPSRLPKAEEFSVILKIIEYIKSNDCKIYKQIWQKYRDIALIILLYTSGMRLSESLSILKKDYLESIDFIKILGKGNKYRMIPLINIAKVSIDKYLEFCQFNEQHLFISNTGIKYSPRIFQKNLENIRKNLNLSDNITPHCLRHSCATALLSNGGQIRKIQELLGHVNLSTTQIYTKVNQTKIISEYDKIMNS